MGKEGAHREGIATHHVVGADVVLVATLRGGQNHLRKGEFRSIGKAAGHLAGHAAIKAIDIGAISSTRGSYVDLVGTNDLALARRESRAAGRKYLCNAWCKAARAQNSCHRRARTVV